MVAAAAVPASAATAGFCEASGAKATCTETQTIAGPASISASVSMTSGSAQDATVKYSVTCTLNGDTAVGTGSYTADTPVTDTFTLPFTDPTSCVATATGTLSGTGDMLLALNYTTPSTSTPPPAPTGHLVKGYDGKCLDDSGNSSANGAKVVIWTCNSSDAAQLWTYSNGELIHNGKCLNDADWGGIRTKQILYSCDHALNELWTHLSNNEFVLNAKDYKYCLDDPGASKKNGTQVIDYTCKNSSNQHWLKP